MNEISQQGEEWCSFFVLLSVSAFVVIVFSSFRFSDLPLTLWWKCSDEFRIPRDVVIPDANNEISLCVNERVNSGTLFLKDEYVAEFIGA